MDSVYDNSDSLTDEELAARALAGDVEAFSDIYQRYFDRVYDHVFRRVRDQSEALDIAQETFMRLLPGRDTRPPETSITAWLFTVARNISTNRLVRANRVQHAWTGDSDDDDPILYQTNLDPEDNPESAVLRQDESRLVWQAAQGLSDDDQSLLDLSIRQELSPQEIAEVFGLSRAAVDTRLTRARAALEDAIVALKLVQVGNNACQEFTAILNRYRSEGGLDLRTRRALLRHVRSCDICEKTRSTIVTAAELLAGLAPVYLAADVKDELLANLLRDAASLSPDAGAASGDGTSIVSGEVHRGISSKALALAGSSGAFVIAAVSAILFFTFGNPFDNSPPVPPVVSDISGTVGQEPGQPATIPLAFPDPTPTNTVTPTTVPATANAAQPLATVSPPTTTPTATPTLTPTEVPTATPIPVTVEPTPTPQPVVERFHIEVGDVVAPGRLEEGAGEIAVPGDSDVFTFEGLVGQIVYFDELFSSHGGDCAGGLTWTLLDPDGGSIFSDELNEDSCDSDPGQFALSSTGAYTIQVGESEAEDIQYSFGVVNVPVIRTFDIEIGEQVSPDAPSAGAGRLNLPEESHIFVFEAEAGQQVYFDEQVVDETTCDFPPNWRLAAAPGGQAIFDQELTASGCGSDPGVITLPARGEYRVRVTASRGGAVEYGFQLHSIPAPEEFAISIGETIEPGYPDSGAGVLESPGAVDTYRFQAVPGQVVQLDTAIETPELCAKGVSISIATDAESAVHSSVLQQDSCSGHTPEITLESGGEYRIAVRAESDASGAYSMTVLNVPVIQAFYISIGDVVSEDQPRPGSGRIDLPGETDTYYFTAEAGKNVHFFEDSYDYPPCEQEFFWRLSAPDGTSVFETDLNTLYCGEHVGNLTLEQSGQYSLAVWAGPGTYGNYSFLIAHASGFGR